MKRGGDVMVAVGIIFIIIMIIIPVPKPLLDVLLSVNISFALLILLITIYTSNILDFSAFPSILLIATMFRLALNVSTTRYILLDGDAGSVIRAFGNFVISGDAVVGFIVFVIIVLINFLVITKGSERVAEVAARFTLDAMPGKQMAIDADLNAGLVSEEEAKIRRKNIQSEADFYGAMDGASKFVKGDAIAGIVITFINIAAGLAMGVIRQNMDIGTALQAYTILTVGDGLVSQIPALTISTATGIIVTRAASETDLGSDLILQLFGKHRKILFILAGVLFGLGSTPLPTIPFYMLAGILIFIGITNKNKATEEIEEEDEVPEESAEELRNSENVMDLLKVEDIEMEFGYGIIPLADTSQGGDLLDRIVMIRRQIAMELGLIVPMVRLRDNIQLKPNEYIIKIKGVESSRYEILFDHYLAMNPGYVEEDIEGQLTTEPAFGLPARWILEHDREKAEMVGYTVVDPPSVIATHLTEIIKQNAHNLLGRQDVKNLIDNAREEHSAVVEEVIPNMLNLGDIQKVLINLLKEQISIRNMVMILETLADYAKITRDPDILTEYVRQNMVKWITKKYVLTEGLNVITLSSELEQLIMNSIVQSETGSYLNLAPDVVQRMLNSLSNNLEIMMATGDLPIVLTAPIVRIYFKRLTEQLNNDIIVLSYNEIESTVEIQTVGRVSI